MTHRKSCIVAATIGARSPGERFTSPETTALGRRRRCLGSGAWRRPRGSVGRVVSPVVATGDPSAEILAAASALFGERGVAGTTMSQIAVGSRAAAVVALLLLPQQGGRPRGDPAREANVSRWSWSAGCAPSRRAPAVRLHRFVAGDVAALCVLPFDINEVHRFAARDRERFACYWSERRTLRNAAGRRRARGSGGRRAARGRRPARGADDHVQRRGGAELVSPRRASGA